MDNLISILVYVIVISVPIFLWEKAKNDERYGVLLTSLIFSIIYVGYKVYWTDENLSDIVILEYILGYCFIIAILLTLAICIIETALNTGKKEHQKLRLEYEELKNKNELTDQEMKRLKYLENKKGYLMNEFNPDRFDI